MFFFLPPSEAVKKEKSRQKVLFLQEKKDEKGRKLERKGGVKGTNSGFDLRTLYLRIAELQNWALHGITEWFGLEKSSELILFQPFHHPRLLQTFPCPSLGSPSAGPPQSKGTQGNSSPQHRNIPSSRSSSNPMATQELSPPLSLPHPSGYSG